MVNEITPTYYAAGTPSVNTIIRGENFDLIPNDARIVWATDNNNPEEFKGTNVGQYRFVIVSKTNNEMELRQEVEGSHGVLSFVGAIYSREWSVTFWVNNTNPLP